MRTRRVTGTHPGPIHKYATFRLDLAWMFSHPDLLDSRCCPAGSQCYPDNDDQVGESAKDLFTPDIAMSGNGFSCFVPEIMATRGTG